MAKIVTILLGLVLLGCQKSIDTEAVEAASVDNRVSQEVIDLLNMPININLEGDAAFDSFNYINLKIFEIISNKRESLTTTIKPKEWSYFCIDVENQIYFTNNAISIGAAISRINIETNTISLIGSSGWLVLPSEVALDKNAYRIDFFPNIFVKVEP